MKLSDKIIEFEDSGRKYIEDYDIKKSINKTLSQIYKELRLTGNREEYCFLRIFRENFGDLVE